MALLLVASGTSAGICSAGEHAFAGGSERAPLALLGAARGGASGSDHVNDALSVGTTGPPGVLVVAGNAACSIELLDAAGGVPLARVPLPPGRDFALVYTHSVTLRPVESRYVVRGNAIVQTAEVFDDHGPGMSSEALPGERLEKAGGAYVLSMARPIPRLVVRRHERAAFRLVADGQTIALDHWRAPSIELRPDCTGAAR